jgi:uncharacterized membrane protein YfcA
LSEPILTLSFLPLAPGLLILTCAAAFFVGLSKGGLPAIGSLAVPVLSLQLSPVTAAALLLPIYVLTDMVGVWLYRREYSPRNLKILIPASLCGVVLGWATASYLSDAAIAFLVGAMGIGFCLNTWLRSQGSAVPGRVPAGLFWGALAGYTSFVSHSGAPPFQIYVLPQRMPKMVFAGTSTIVFAIVNAAKIIPYAQLRPFSAADVRTTVFLVPVAVIGTIVGAVLTHHIRDAVFFRLVQVALFAVSLKLIFDATQSIWR